MPCYIITYHTRNGTYTASKWADNAKKALRLLKRAHNRSTRKMRQPITYDEPVLVVPQPFSDESRALRAAASAAESVPTIEFHPSDEPPIDDSNVDRGEGDEDAT